MDVKEAILARRSIRKYKPDPVSEEIVTELLEAARWAPSGTNHQPWRFVVVRNPEVKVKIREAAFNQKPLTEAPVVLVCCADLTPYARDTRKRIEELVAAGALDPSSLENYPGLSQSKEPDALKKLAPHAMLNVAIAMEHIALRAVSLGLGTCWIQLMKAREIAKILELPEHLIITGLMPVGYPDQNPAPRPRVSLADIIYKVVE